MKEWERMALPSTLLLENLLEATVSYAVDTLRGSVTLEYRQSQTLYEPTAYF